MSPDFLSEVTIQAGGAIENDRRFALTLRSTLFDSNTPHWLPKTNFIALMRNETLAKLETIFHDETDTLKIFQDGKQVINAKLIDKLDCIILENFFSNYLNCGITGKLRFVEAKGETIFTDKKKKLISIINLASVRDIEKSIGKSIDPTRFRANIYIDGLRPWSEFNWVDKMFSCGGMVIEIKKRIERCSAINVDPKTGVRDINLVNLIQNNFGHIDMGVFAEVKKGGHIAVGNNLRQCPNI